VPCKYLLLATYQENPGLEKTATLDSVFGLKNKTIRTKRRTDHGNDKYFLALNNDQIYQEPAAQKALFGLILFFYGAKSRSIICHQLLPI
jgi:hypothetical protein